MLQEVFMWPSPGVVNT